MSQDNSLKSGRGQILQAAQITSAKRLQSEDARTRSQQLPRRTSGSSTSNSEVTLRPPQVYRAPQINVPANLHEAAKLIHSELEKIAQSQSVVLTLWRKYEAQHAELVSVKKQLATLQGTQD